MCARPVQDEVEIVHQEGDEVQRHADVEDKIIRQVDQLVEYFNSLFHDDQLDIRCARVVGVCCGLCSVLFCASSQAVKAHQHPATANSSRT